MQAPEALSIDEWYARARGSGRIFPGWLAARAILSIGMPFYGPVSYTHLTLPTKA